MQQSPILNLNNIVIYHSFCVQSRLLTVSHAHRATAVIDERAYAAIRITINFCFLSFTLVLSAFRRPWLKARIWYHLLLFGCFRVRGADFGSRVLRRAGEGDIRSATREALKAASQQSSQVAEVLDAASREQTGASLSQHLQSGRQAVESVTGVFTDRFQGEVCRRTPVLRS